MSDDASLYPLTPGYNNTDTSRAAAEEMESRADVLRKTCLMAIRRAPRHDPGLLLAGVTPQPKKTPPVNASGQAVGLTVMEIVALTGEPSYNINPRVSELRAAGLVRDSGVRRVNEHSGKKAIAWTPGDDPEKSRPEDNSPPKAKAQREAYARGMAAAFWMLHGREEMSVDDVKQLLRRRLHELDQDNPTWEATRPPEESKS